MGGKARAGWGGGQQASVAAGTGDHARGTAPCVGSDQADGSPESESGSAALSGSPEAARAMLSPSHDRGVTQEVRAASLVRDQELVRLLVITE